MLHLSASCHYYMCNSATDLRKGFDSLCGLVSSTMKGDPLSKAIFIFFNKSHDQVKLLLWEGDGFSIYHKRLEKGTYEVAFCNSTDTSVSISSEQLQFILQGVSLKSVHKRKRYQHMAGCSG